MKLLALDSSGLVASVAILDGETLVAEYTLNYKKTHSQTLLPMLDEIVKMTQTELSEVDAIAVAAGPGSFTGLRIGSATAKGLGLALNKPIISVPTLEGIACNFYGTDALICPMMDARRKQVYTGIYHFAGGTEFEELVAQEAGPVEDIIKKCNAFGQKLGKQVIFLGDGVPVYKDIIEEFCTVEHSYAPAHLSRQRAGAVAIRAVRLYDEGKAEPASDHAPIYLRKSQAERELEAKVKEVRRMRICPMAETDCEQTEILMKECFSVPWSVDALKEMFHTKGYCSFLAKEETEVIGYIGMKVVLDEADITNVAVLPAYRKKGIARKLLQQLLDEARQQGIYSIYLEVRDSNAAAITLYKHAGFKEVGKRKNYYEHPQEDARLMLWQS